MKIRILVIEDDVITALVVPGLQTFGKLLTHREIRKEDDDWKGIFDRLIDDHLYSLIQASTGKRRRFFGKDFGVQLQLAFRNAVLLL